MFNDNLQMNEMIHSMPLYIEIFPSNVIKLQEALLSQTDYATTALH